jgi:hypothetical protein
MHYVHSEVISEHGSRLHTCPEYPPSFPQCASLASAYGKAWHTLTRHACHDLEVKRNGFSSRSTML